MPIDSDRLAAAHRWQETGWVLIENLVPADLVAQALEELRQADRRPEPGPVLRADVVGRSERSDPNRRGPGPAFRAAQFEGTTLFPLRNCPTLNRLFVHPELVEFAAAALGTDDIRMYQSRAWSKHGGDADYEQPMHRDGNHSLIPITNQPGWWHLECFLYLTDVDETSGAPRLVPGETARAALTDRRSLAPAEAPDLYAAEVSAVAPAGSLLAYRSDVWHRGVNLAPDAERHLLVVAFRPAEADWISFDTHGPLVNTADFVTFVADSTPDDLALFGVPRPGHPYWDQPGVLDAMAVTYPGLDLEPWRSALSLADHDAP